MVNAVSAHQLTHVCRWPPHLRERQTPLDALQVLPRNFVAHHMAFLAIVKLLTSATLVDTNHGHTNRPRCFANTET